MGPTLVGPFFLLAAITSWHLELPLAYKNETKQSSQSHFTVGVKIWYDGNREFSKGGIMAPGLLPGWSGRGVFLFSLFLLLIVLASPTLAAPVGTFLQVEGTVEVLRQGKPPAVPAKIGDGVAEGDLVRTKSQSGAGRSFGGGRHGRL